MKMKNTERERETLAEVSGGSQALARGPLAKLKQLFGGEINADLCEVFEENEQCRFVIQRNY